MRWRSRLPWRSFLGGGLGLLATAALLAWLMGAFRTRTAPGRATDEVGGVTLGPTVVVAPRAVPAFEAAVGTIRAIHETAVASRILGRIAVLRVERAGQQVERGEVLVELEAAELEAAAEAAHAAVTAALAHRDRARLDVERTRDLVRGGVAAQARLDQEEAVFKAAEAELERARQAEAGARTALDFATVRAPIGGIVVDKKVNKGDVVQPGQTLFTLYDPSRLQLVAVVREDLAGRLTVGQEVDVGLDALAKTCRGTVTEIVPEAQTRTRSFEVKVAGPCQPGVVTGMFGRLLVPLGSREELRIPGSAVAEVGQLDLVWVVEGGSLQRRYVRVGRSGDDGTVEILAGLAPGEVVLQDARQAPRR